ncbi:2-oxo acid dehydrogenase subunit E2 [Erythrobacter insulae]|uniref:Dihydrolipoamide acetyltransferase component of pyruvate dehydrogenase complex n=1 Tax=Erythrobacter insulae TaxID=2584124 RepID=A0A547PBT7_9SPHN|nr:dihydrolipoamide acetyltransferase family protein [Erythrobacter insulae]TRD11607.1 2-oxo acid dehydrogenase subunit E2 [Erythrobacter insulae]
MGTFVMPSLGADMATGTLVEWLKQPGDELRHGDIIAVVETDKGAIEVEVFEDGRLTELLVEPGSAVPVGTALARIGEESAQGSATAPKVQSTHPLPPQQPASTPAGEPGLVHAEGLRVSPAARRLATELGVDLVSVNGSGPDGAIVRDDIVAKARTRTPQSPAKKAAAKPAASGAPSAAPDLAPMRRAIAAAMMRSKREIPHYYLTHRFDVSPTLQWLEQCNAERPPPERLLLAPLLLKALALALDTFPEFNGFYGEEGFTQSADIHVGTAISIRGGGLAAPAIRETSSLTSREIMIKLRDLVARTRKGEFRSSEIADATITVSSLGDRGVESLLPVIYPPQVAIIGFGSVERRPWATGDAIAIRPVLTATLAGDHRANDGHRGALLLRRIEEILTKPEAL